MKSSANFLFDKMYSSFCNNINPPLTLLIPLLSHGFYFIYGGRLSQKTLAEHKSSQYSEEDPHLVEENGKIPMKTDENGTRRNFALDFMSFV